MNITDKYFIKIAGENSYSDITALVDGAQILKVTGMLDMGEAVNVYNEQWVDGQSEDFMITSNNGTIVRKNVDIEITFIVGQKYTQSPNTTIDVGTQHKLLMDKLTNKDLWIKSAYTNMAVHCVCTGNYKPSTIKLQRGDKSYIIGSVTLHALDAPTVVTN